jgi:hypothetical protein
MKIKGTVAYQSLSGGFWGIIDEDGNKWKPEEMPKVLQKEGLRLEIEAEKAAGGISIFMWGTTIKILEFNIM